jgi:DNA-binding NarL/FixJ family response regulator
VTGRPAGATLAAFPQSGTDLLLGVPERKMATAERDQGRIPVDGVSVVIGEPRPLLRAALGRCLGEHGFSVRGEGVDAAETVALALATRPVIAVVAGNLPGGAITTIVAVRSGTPDTRVVVMAERESVAEALDCIRVGAAGYLSKDIAYESLPHALHCVARGEAGVSRTLTRRLLAERRASGRSDLARAGKPFRRLTLREHEVLQLLSQGASTADIARRLSISPVTARRHRGELRRKLGTRDPRPVAS